MTGKTLSARRVAAMLRRYPSQMLREYARVTGDARMTRLTRRCAKLELARRGAWR